MLQKYYIQADDTILGDGYVELELTVFEFLSLISITLFGGRNKTLGFCLLKLFIKSNRDAKEYLKEHLKLDLNDKYIIQATKELEDEKNGKRKK